MKNSLLYSFSLIFAVLLGVSASAEVYITEIMPCNMSSYLDDQTNYSQYVELYSTAEIDLNGATITHIRKGKDKKNDKVMWSHQFAQVHKLMANTYSLLMFGADKEEPSNGAKNAGHFYTKLEYKASTLRITSAAGKLIAEIEYPDQVPGISYSMTEGYMIPTPGAENNDGYTSLSERASKPSFSSNTPPGVFFASKSAKVEIVVPSGSEVYYTIDGSEVKKGEGTAQKYDSAFVVKATTPVRARAYKKNKLPSDELVGSFILKNDRYEHCEGENLPIVHIITDEKYLKGDRIGIATVGTNGKEGKCSDDENKASANYYQDWSRPAIFEYYEDGEMVCSQPVEIGVFGGCSRKYKVKSFKIKASKKTGNNRLGYTNFFKEKNFSEVKSLQLRNGGNGYENMIFRDGFMQSLCKGMGIDYQAYQPVAYYINGEYKRLMGLRERTNADYVFHNYGIDEEDVDHLEIAKEAVTPSKGTIDRYDSMVAYVENHYDDEDFYDRLAEYMDVDEYINWLIFEQYIVNTDWPANNTKIWRRKKDGKFRWILYDTDFGFGIYGGGAPNYTSEYTDMIAFSLGEGSNINWGNGSASDPEEAWKTTLFRHCLKNADFQRKYITRYRKIVSEVFAHDRVMAVYDSVAALVTKDLCASKAGSPDDYRGGVSSFSKNRPEYALKYLRNYFGMQDEKVECTFKMKCDTAVPGFAFLFNKERKEKTSYTYEALKGQSVKIEPLVPCGYKIDSLVSSVNTVKTKVTKILISATSWYYYYEKDAPKGDWKSLSYSETGWSKGKGRIGFSPRESFDTGIKQDTTKMTAYFRTKITLDAVPEMASMNITYDDGFVLYVNGKEVKRVNMPDSVDVVYSTPAIEYVNEVSKSLDIQGKYFKEGENIIAIEMHQNVANSSDLVFAASGNVTSVSSPAQANSSFESAIMEKTNVTLYLSKIKNYTPPRLYINEVCSSNTRVTDQWDAKPDWIEIYNAEDYEVDLAGMLIKNLRKDSTYVFPSGRLETRIPAKGHTMVWASKNKEDGPMHTGFKLNAASPEKIALYQTVYGKEVLVDAMEYEVHEQNGSFGRVSDGGSLMEVFFQCESPSNHGSIIPTPGNKNGEICDETDIEDSIAEIKKGIELYPNPASNVIFISLIEGKEAEWSIIDFSGRQVMSGVVVDGKTVAEVGSLSAGVYAVRVQTVEDVFTEIFIKK